MKRPWHSSPGFYDTHPVIAESHHDGTAFHGTSGILTTAKQAADRAATLDATGSQGVYHRATTLTALPGTGQRGGAEHAWALPGLWADADFGSLGHKHDPTRTEGRPLPPDADAARQLVLESGLPHPSLWVHSGGGLYPWWLLDTPLLLATRSAPGRGTVRRVAAHPQEVRREPRLGVRRRRRRPRPRAARPGHDEPQRGGQERPCPSPRTTGSSTRSRAARGRPGGTQAACPPGAAARPQACPSPRRLLRRPVPAGRPGRERHLRRHPGRRRLDPARRPATPAPSCGLLVARPVRTAGQPCTRPLSEQPNVLVVFSGWPACPPGGRSNDPRPSLRAHARHGGDENAAARDIAAAIAVSPLHLPQRRLPCPGGPGAQR